MNPLRSTSAALLILVLAGCSGRSFFTGDGGSSGGGSADQGSSLPVVLRGRTLMRCDLMTAAADGSALDGLTRQAALLFRANGTYQYLLTYGDGTACNGMFAGGTEDVFDYDQEGTYAIDADLGSSTYELSLTMSAQRMTARTGPIGAPMASALATLCPSIPFAADTAVDVGAATCATAPTTYLIPSTLPLTTVFKLRVAIPDSNQNTDVTVSGRANVLSPGDTNAILPATEIWKVYQ